MVNRKHREAARRKLFGVSRYFSYFSTGLELRRVVPHR
jgi:hypothetical protein